METMETAKILDETGQKELAVYNGTGWSFTSVEKKDIQLIRKRARQLGGALPALQDLYGHLYTWERMYNLNTKTSFRAEVGITLVFLIGAIATIVVLI